MKEDSNAGLWVCSSCGSLPAERVVGGFRSFSGLVCDECSRVLCGSCADSRGNRICECGGLLDSTPFDLSKKPSQFTVKARAKGESVKAVQGCLLLVFLIAFAILPVVAIANSSFTSGIKALRYVIITIGIIVATIGLKKKKMGVLFLGAAIIVAGQYLERAEQN